MDSAAGVKAMLLQAPVDASAHPVDASAHQADAGAHAAVVRFRADVFEARDRLVSGLTDEVVDRALSEAAPQPARALVSRRGRRALCGVASVIGAVAIALTVYFVTRPKPPPPASPSPYATACTVFCEGPLLAAVQSARLWNDSKTFVDMPLTVDPADVLSAFAAAFPDGGANASRADLAAFVNRYFLTAGSDTAPWVPDDYQAYPTSLSGLRNASLQEFALGLNDLWLQLGRRFKPSVRDFPQRYSLVWQPNPMIVPGGRFLESYYWDSEWVIMGLLRSNMTRTATVRWFLTPRALLAAPHRILRTSSHSPQGVALNLVHLLDQFGFVPNGGRIYYALPGRSQPPLLSSMVREIYAATGDLGFLAYVYPSLLNEYAWWMRTGPTGHAVVIDASATAPPPPAAAEAADADAAGDMSAEFQPRVDRHELGMADGFVPPPRTLPQRLASAQRAAGGIYTLNRYVTNQTTPRPESWYEDVHTAASAGYAANSTGAQILYAEIAAGAETGWDFSSRWFGDGMNVATCDTSRVIPVDLNAMLYAVETNLAFFAGELGTAVAQRNLCGGVLREWVAATAASMSDGSAGNGSAAMVRARRSVLAAAESTSFLRASRWQQGAAACYRLARHLSPGFNFTREAIDAVAAAAYTAFRDDMQRFAGAADMRLAAMEALMWDEATGAWSDLILVDDVQAPPTPAATVAPQVPSRVGSLAAAATVADYFRVGSGGGGGGGGGSTGTAVVRSNITSASNYVPLWTGAYPIGNATRVGLVLASLANSSLLQVGGLATTTANTTQQWDWPNGWAPLQHMLVLGLNATGIPAAQAMATDLARRWLQSCYVAYISTGYMHEKYDVTSVGGTGSGGEYLPQVGFGWTNGVALDLLMRYNFDTLE